MNDPLKQQRGRWAQVLLSWAKEITLLTGLFLLMEALWRVVFLLKFGDLGVLQGFKKDLFQAFILGARFDLTIFCYINSLPLLAMLLFILLLPVMPQRIRRVGDLKSVCLWGAVYYSAMILLVNFINAVDFNFYSFYQDRINVLVFGIIQDDTWALIRTIWKDYPVVWVFLALFVGTALLLGWLKKRFQKAVSRAVPSEASSSVSLGWLSALVIFLGVFLLNGVGARGSLGLFPLGEMDTGISANSFVNQLCFNSVRALSRAIELKKKENSRWDSNLQYYGYGDNYRQAFADYFEIPLAQVPADPLELLQHKTPLNTYAAKNPPHVLLLVMESFGSFWLKYNSSQFDLLGGMQKHFNQDQVLFHFLSSTPATIGSLSSLMAGTMQRPISEFLSESMYLQTPFRSAPAFIYKNAGYRTRFVYGGNPGWREINKFARFQSFDTVEGQNEIFSVLGGSHETHDWGVYDEDVWEYLWKTLNEASGPQFVLAMTTTNHPPFQLPKAYQRPALTIPESLLSRMIGGKDLAARRFDTYRYSMDKLAQFLDRIKNSPLRDKVVVAVTGDHNFWMINFNSDELMQKSAVPFYLYLPKPLRQEIPKETFGAHPDILPTLYNLTLSQTSYESTAVDLRAPGPHYAFDYSKLILGPQGGAMAEGTEDHFYNWEGDYERLVPAVKDPEKESMSRHYKALMGVLDYYMKRERELAGHH